MDIGKRQKREGASRELLQNIGTKNLGDYVINSYSQTVQICSGARDERLQNIGTILLFEQINYCWAFLVSEP